MCIALRFVYSHRFVDILNDSLLCCQVMGSTFLFKTVPMETGCKMHKLYLLQNWCKINRPFLQNARVYFAIMTSRLYIFHNYVRYKSHFMTFKTFLIYYVSYTVVLTGLCFYRLFHNKWSFLSCALMWFQVV